MGAVSGNNLGGNNGGAGGGINGIGSEINAGASNISGNKYINPLGVGNSNLLGPGGGAPQLANVQQGTSVGDVQNAQNQTGNSLAAQQNLLAALQNQNGLGAQSALMNQMAGSNGIGAQNSALSGLGNAANMYGQIAQGQGPNPAQAMLNQQTGANVANQAALMAGQRGAGANTGLLARQAAMQGANTQQQAVGQGATMQASQQLNALQGLTGANQAIGGLGSTQVGQTAGMANQLAGQQIGQVNANTQANLANQQQMQNALGAVNQANVSNQASVNAGNTGLAQSQLTAKSGLFGGLMNGVGALAGAEGGEVPKLAEGGDPDEFQSAPPAEMQQDPNAPSSSFGKYLNAAESTAPKSGSSDSSDMATIGTIASLFAADGGLAEKGGHVKAKEPSQKAVKEGNSYDNDKIPAKLSEGEIVLPREVTMSQDPVAAAAKFVADTIAKRKSIPEKPAMFAEGDEVTAEDPGAEVEPAQEQPPMPAAAPAAVPQAAPAAQPQMPQAQTAPAPQPEVPDHIKAAEDLASGKITPETYHSLFAKKDTLGKIGTIFGLMLSGAGSGLAHQPNMLLHMMDKQIDNDLDAQKQDKENARNFLSTMSNINLQKAQAGSQNMNTLINMTEEAPKAAIAGQKTEDIGESPLFNQFDKRGKEILDSLSAKQVMREATYDHLNKISAGSPQAQSVLQSQVRPVIDQANANDEAKKKLVEAASAKKQTEVYNKQLLEDAVTRGAQYGDDAARQIKGKPGKPVVAPGDEMKLRAELAKEENLRKQESEYLRIYGRLAKMPAGGESLAGTGIKVGGDIASGIFGGIPGAIAGGAASNGVGNAADKFFNTDRNQLMADMRKQYGDQFAESMFPGLGATPKNIAEGAKLAKEFFSRQKQYEMIPKYKTKIPDLISEDPFLKEEEKKAASPKKTKSAPVAKITKEEKPSEEGGITGLLNSFLKGK